MCQELSALEGLRARSAIIMAAVDRNARDKSTVQTTYGLP
jgi:hypothetical protein